MAEAATRYIVQFEEGFPRAEVEALGAELMAAGILAPGFIPPSAGFLRLEAIVYAKDEQGYDTVVLPDRNLVSRMARVARDGHAELRDKTTRSAVALMAYCQAMQIQLEPSIAFHELGSVLGNSIAREELAWFRAADRGAVLDWVALAAGQKDRVALGDPAAPSDLDFEKPIARWRRNYVVALKAAELELTPADAPLTGRCPCWSGWTKTSYWRGRRRCSSRCITGPRRPGPDSSSSCARPIARRRSTGPRMRPGT